MSPFYSDSERAIYRYHDGEREVFGDPLELRRRLLEAAGGDLAGLAELACVELDGGDLDGGDAAPPAPEEPARQMARSVAQGKLAAVIRQAFTLAPFDPATGKGVTEAMCWRVWADFHEGLEGNANGGESSRTSAPPTAFSPGQAP